MFEYEAYVGSSIITSSVLFVMIVIIKLDIPSIAPEVIRTSSEVKFDQYLGLYKLAIFSLSSNIH